MATNAPGAMAAAMANAPRNARSIADAPSTTMAAAIIAAHVDPDAAPDDAATPVTPTSTGSKLGRFFVPRAFATIGDPGEGLVFKNGRDVGTRQTRICEVFMEVADTGVTHMWHIVKRVPPSGKNAQFLLQQPSTGGAFKAGVFKTSEDSLRDWKLFCGEVVRKWTEFRIAEVAAKKNKPTAEALPTESLDASNVELLTALGYVE